MKIKTRIRFHIKPSCISCGRPTKTATKTVYGILPFCMMCGKTKRENRQNGIHVLYGKNFKTNGGD